MVCDSTGKTSGALTLGIDLGTSFIKVSVFDPASGACVAAAQAPDQEFPIMAPQAGFAEQEPALWWGGFKQALAAVRAKVDLARVAAIGIAYQMHGLVPVDANGEPVHPAIIWCDSRAVACGEQAFAGLGSDYCLTHLLNSPGNFTASKLKWLQAEKPDAFARVAKVQLPGDYIALRLTGQARTTYSGLSEGIFWDFAENRPAAELLKYFGFSQDVLAEALPTFGPQGTVTQAVAAELGIPAGIPVTYRAGDQPNNAFSLNALEPGEVAATAGTSGVIYAVSDKMRCDAQSRVNIFAHVNHTPQLPRCGILMCINGTGSANAWLRRTLGSGVSYPQMNDLAAAAPAGADGLSFLPFGNGAERFLNNRDLGAQLCGLNFNRHGAGHLCRAAQEGIVYAFRYGFEIMRGIGVTPTVIRAGRANMFLSPVFRQTFADALRVPVELYETDGALGAARGAALGAGLYEDAAAAFKSLTRLERIDPQPAAFEQQDAAYGRWLERLNTILK